MDNTRSRTVNTRTQATKSPMSKETQQLLKLMMEESKLTNFQRRQLSSRARDGKALPLSCNPTSSKQKNNLSPSKQSPKKVSNGKNLSGSGKRPKEVIDVLVEKNKETFKPLPGKAITEKDKTKLQNQMAYGDDLPAVDTRKNKRTDDVQDDDMFVEMDEFDEVLKQIEERRNFLNEMETLGQGVKYRSLIQTEISQKIRQLELIDKQRTKELEQLLQNKSNDTSSD